ncbi:MAG: polyprenol monophosphomannose synthase [Candidatus Omnitrophota bacterium]|jgi:dolichol-phosphate mannosyltransferase
MISIVIPTYNEAENIRDILIRTMDAMNAVRLSYEIIVVDDSSPDETVNIAINVLKNNGKVICRLGKPRSLSLSVLDGINAANGEAVVIMDADGSHPPELINEFYTHFSLGYDLAIASRYVAGGGTTGFSLSRKIISYGACLLGRFVTSVHDNTSGYFCIRRSCLEGVKLTPRGFKIGLEIFVKAKYRSYKEIPYIFSNRAKGKSKLGSKVMLQYILQLIELLRYRIFSGRRFGRRN